MNAELKVKVNTVPLRSSNVDQILPLLDYCLDRKIELRFIELMNMGHLKHNRQYEREFVSMDMLLDVIGKKYKYFKTEARFDSTSVRYEIPDRGTFGIIANESAPFCRTCTRLRIASNGYLYGCLSSSKFQPVRHLLDMPTYQAINELQGILREAMAVKQRVAFTGETTVMKFIGG